MSGDTAPSWLTDDAAVDAGAKLAKNPAVQKAAVKAAKDPRVQKAATDAAMRKLNNDPTWASGDDESASADDVEANVGPQKSPRPGMEIPEEELKNIKSWHLYLRIAYVLAAALLAAAACLMLETQPAAGIAFFSVYVFCFSLLIAAFELHLSMVARVIAQNFGFMYSFSGRWIFLLFVGFMAFSLGDIGIAAMSFLYLCGFLQTYLVFKFPHFTEYQRGLHYDLHNK